MTPRRPSRAVLTTLQWIGTAAIVALIAWVLYTQRSELRGLLDLDAATLALLVLGNLVLFLMNGMVLRTVVLHFGTPMRLTEAILIALVDSTLNYLPMKAGTVATGAILYARHRVRVADFAAMVTGNTVINIWVCTTMGAIVLITRGLALGLSWVLLVLPTAGVFALVVWGRRHPGGLTESAHPSRLMRGIARLGSGVRLIFRDAGVMLTLIALNVGRVLVSAALLKLEFSALSSPVSWPAAIVLSTLATLLGRLSILPAGLGFREAGVAATSALLGGATAVGLAVSVIDRGVTFVLLVALGVPAVLAVSRSMPLRDIVSSAERGSS